MEKRKLLFNRKKTINQQADTELNPLDGLSELLNRNYLVSPFVIPKKQFRFMSYNILADSIALQHQDNITEDEPKYFDWNFRSALILKEIMNYNPDILCLQEVDFNILTFQEEFGDDYFIFYRKRTNDKSDGCMTLVRKSKYKILESHYLEFYHSSNHPLLCRDNVCIILAIQSLDHENTVLIVANTHILFNERRGDIKTAQIYLAMKACSIIAEKYSNQGVHIIYGGDFNSTPMSGIYEFIKTGEFDFRDVQSSYLSGQRFGTLRSKDSTLLTEELVSNKDDKSETRFFHAFLSRNIERFIYDAKLKEKNFDPLKHWITDLARIELIISDSKKEMEKIEFEITDFGHDFSQGIRYALILKNDINMQSAYATFQKVYNGFNYQEYPSKIQHPMNSTFEPFFTHKTNYSLLTVDYIWYCTKIPYQRKELKPIAVYELPSLEKLQMSHCSLNQSSKLDKIPNNVFPSDHFSLVVDFDIY